MSEETEVIETGEEVIEHDVELNERVDELEKGGKDLMTLLSDQEIMQVIEAKQAGHTVKIEVVKPEPKPTAKDKTKELVDKLPEDDPNRDILGHLAQLLEDQIAPLTERLEAVEGHAVAGAQKEITAEVAKAREKFSDFDEYKAEMVQLSKDLPNLKIPELYIIAKSRKNGLDLANPATFTEKPASTTVSKKNSTTKPTERLRGRKGRSAMLAEALDGQDFSDVEYRS